MVKRLQDTPGYSENPVTETVGNAPQEQEGVSPPAPSTPTVTPPQTVPGEELQVASEGPHAQTTTDIAGAAIQDIADSAAAVAEAVMSPEPMTPEPDGYSPVMERLTGRRIEFKVESKPRNQITVDNLVNATDDTGYQSVFKDILGTPSRPPVSAGEIVEAGSGGVADAPGFSAPDTSLGVLPEVMSRYEGKRMPASIRLNNMGGISITGSRANVPNSWAAKQPGFVGIVKRPANEGGWYAQYATPGDGIRAASNLLINYGGRGINTTAKIADRWAVGSVDQYANTTTRYLKEAGFNVSKNTPLDLNNPAVRLAILKAKSAHESGFGRPVYEESLFTQNVS